jgi:hypothetical protein
METIFETILTCESEAVRRRERNYVSMLDDGRSNGYVVELLSKGGCSDSVATRRVDNGATGVSMKRLRIKIDGYCETDGYTTNAQPVHLADYYN